MATVAGNILQRTRCPYFRDVHASCNRRQPGSGCDALDGFNRGHAVLGVSEHCIATHPSDMCVGLAVLDAVVHTVRADGSARSIPFGEFHHAPGDTPHVEFALEYGELITHIVIPNLPAARRSHYLKVRDRASYEFALASAAVVLDLDGDTIRAARLGLGGIATKPWRANEAEQSLTGRKASDARFRDAAEIALDRSRSRESTTTSRSSWRSAPSCGHSPPRETRTYEHNNHGWCRRHPSGSRRRASQGDGCRHLPDRCDPSRPRARGSGAKHDNQRAHP